MKALERAGEISHACTWGMDPTRIPAEFKPSLGRAQAGSWPCRSGVRLGTAPEVRCTLRLTTCTPHQLSSGEGGIPAHPRVGLLRDPSCLDHLEMKPLKAPELGV